MTALTTREIDMHLNHDPILRASQPVDPRCFMLPVLLVFLGVVGLLGVVATEPPLDAVADEPAAGVAVLVMLSAAATGSALPALEPRVAPAALAPHGDTTVPSADSALRDLPTPTGETHAPTF